MAETATSILDSPMKASFNYFFTSVPFTDCLRVPVVPLRVSGEGSVDYVDDLPFQKASIVCEEDLDTCFFCPDLDLMEVGGKPKTIKLPSGFYCGEFLALNPLDIQELLMFQHKYGRVVGAREKKPFFSDEKELLEPVPDGTVFAGRNAEKYSQQLRGIQSSAKLFHEVPKEEYVDAEELLKLGAVAFREAIAAVLDTQKVIRATTRVLREDLGPMTVGELVEAKEASEYLAAILAHAVPGIELVPDGMTERQCGLLPAVLCQLARGLLNNDAYRVCANPECGHLFTPRDMDRRLDTKYCSMECQERAKRLRYLVRHKEGEKKNKRR